MADLNLTNLAAILDSFKVGDEFPRYVFKYVRDVDADGNGSPNPGWYRFERDANNPDSNYYYVRDMTVNSGQLGFFNDNDIIIIDDTTTTTADAGIGNDTYIIMGFSGRSGNIDDNLGKNTIIIDPSLTIAHAGLKTAGGKALYLLNELNQEWIDQQQNPQNNNQPYTLQELIDGYGASGYVPIEFI